jgi:hypothetical protein
MKNELQLSYKVEITKVFNITEHHRDLLMMRELGDLFGEKKPELPAIKFTGYDKADLIEQASKLTNEERQIFIYENENFEKARRAAMNKWADLIQQYRNDPTWHMDENFAGLKNFKNLLSINIFIVIDDKKFLIHSFTNEAYSAIQNLMKEYECLSLINDFGESECFAGTIEVWEEGIVQKTYFFAGPGTIIKRKKVLVHPDSREFAKLQLKRDQEFYNTIMNNQSDL